MALQNLKEQGLPGSLVLTTSANAVVAKKGLVAYDTPKAAANHLVGELAVELAPLIRVNGVARRPSCRAARCSARARHRQPVEIRHRLQRERIRATR
jgi:NAD(P)-dependent dehydrogenase (short-subunit alcohol dehydrogenase family)